ncbi:hypothetical protein J6590_020453 [Homalodisca vitripennis]|nr:hypothetical protein J6590_020453 [Homalodisca vitripennis]
MLTALKTSLGNIKITERKGSHDHPGTYQDNSTKETIGTRLSFWSMVTYMIEQEEDWSAVAAHAQPFLK